MVKAIYRKYRPQIFADLVGQNHIKITLLNEIEKNEIAHAYLFSGPRGIGKTTVARLMAKAINCEKRKGSEPCNKCDSCKEIMEGRSMDLIEIDAASHTGVDNVRENIIENARFTPSKSKYKIFIIDEVHMLSLSAFNALLKTLEEPPEHVNFILATTEIFKVPETIISRCQRFDFKKISIQDLVKRLQFVADEEKVKVDKEIFERIAVRAEGSVRDAEVLLSQMLALGEKKITKDLADLIIPRSDIDLIYQLFNFLVKRDSVSAISLINKLINEGVNLQEFSRDFIEFLRKILLRKIYGSSGQYSLDFDKELEKKIDDDLQLVQVNNIVKIIETFIDKSRNLKFSDIPQLPLELAIIEVCQSEDVQTVDNPVNFFNNDNKKDNTANKKLYEKENLKEVNKNIVRPAGIKFEEVKEKWHEIINNLKKYNHSLAIALKSGVPFEIEKDILKIGFKFKFHADKIKEKKNIIKVEEAAKESLNSDVKVKPEIIDSQKFDDYKKDIDSLNKNESEGVGEALNIFGGELV